MYLLQPLEFDNLVVYMLGEHNPVGRGKQHAKSWVPMPLAVGSRFYLVYIAAFHIFSFPVVLFNSLEESYLFPWYVSSSVFVSTCLSEVM